MIKTDCFAYYGEKCHTLTKLICDKSAYCSFYKPESANCNRTQIEYEVDCYSSPHKQKKGDSLNNEETYTKSIGLSQTDKPYSYKPIETP